MQEQEDKDELQRMEQALLAALESAFGYVGLSLIEILRHAAAETPDRPALLEPGRESLTYAGLLSLAERTAGKLNALGFGREERVALALPSTAEGAAAYLSVMAGMTIIPVNPHLPADEHERYLRHTRAGVVLVRQGAGPAPAEAARRLGIPAVELRYSAGGPVGEFEIDAPQNPAARPEFAGPGDTAFVLPTSGTTSLPKLVPRTHKELAFVGYLGYLLFHPRDKRSIVLSILPLHHASGFSPMLRSVAGRAGFASVLASNLDAVYGALALYRPARLLVVPAVLQTLVDRAPAGAGRLGLERITAVSAALSEDLLRHAERVFGAAVQLLYGMTEMNTIASTALPGESPAGCGPGCVGRALPFCEVEIADEDGNPLPQGRTGEIVVRSPLVFAGYENDPEATAAAFRDGWFRTGDAGHRDAGGYIHLTGRVKEMINRGGSKVSPADVDAVLAEHPAVVEAATFAFPHSTLGEDVAAAVVVRDPGVTERELRSFAARRLASYKVPSRFVFVSEIPRTPLGKTRRLALTEQFQDELRR